MRLLRHTAGQANLPATTIPLYLSLDIREFRHQPFANDGPPLPGDLSHFGHLKRLSSVRRSKVLGDLFANRTFLISDHVNRMRFSPISPFIHQSILFCKMLI